MRVLIIADAVFATREASMLGRLEVGLADDGVRPIIAIPAGTEVPDQLGRAAPVIAYERSPLPLGWRLAVQPFVRELRERLDGPDPTLDVVHAFGGAAWRFGLEIARQTGAGLALEVWRTGLVDRLRGMKRLANNGAQGSLAATREGTATSSSEVPLVFTAPDRVVERAIADTNVDIPVVLAPWGVHANAEPRSVCTRDTIGVVLAGGGRDAHHAAAAFEGWARTDDPNRTMLLFADARLAERAQIWKLAGKLGVRDRVSLVDDLELRRDLALRADLMLHPDARGERRTLVLDAMAVGMPIVAASDPAADELIDGRTASIVRTPDAEAWHAAISALITNPESARSLGASALAYVREHHRASAHLAATIGAYERLTLAEQAPMPWPGSA
ncbi:MAG: glycosyltransferase [Planctomycetota bacterium]